MNGIIIVDKPPDWTSHDAVGKLRGIFREKRIGHGGTLDPMATGVLPVFIGRATRAVEFCENAAKEYVAGIRLGIRTDTQDITGNITDSTGCGATLEELKAAAAKFIGRQLQTPPMYSAVKIGGKKLYELARKGIEVERKPREITVSRLDASEKDGEFFLNIVCSKGTYVRTLCSDIGDSLGCGGVMSSLRRVRAGAFTIDEAVTIQEIAQAGERGELEKLLRPVDSLFSGYPEFFARELQEKRCRCGNDFPADVPDGSYRVYGPEGGFLMLGCVKNGVMKTVKSFFEV